MTVICWDSRYLAADRMVCMSDRRGIPIQKLKALSVGKVVDIFGGCGSAALLPEWVKWLQDDPATRGFAPKAGDSDMTGIRVIIAGEVMAYDYDTLGFSIVIPDGMRHARGSGAAVAKGAMLAGATAMEAVLFASQEDFYCGDGCDYFDTQHPDKGIQRHAV